MRGNSVRNNPIVEQDMVMAEDMFGEDLSCLKGKTTRRTLKAIINDAMSIPWELRNRKDIALHIDAICVNMMPFLTLIGHPIMFRMCSSMQGTLHEEHHGIVHAAH